MSHFEYTQTKLFNISCIVDALSSKTSNYLNRQYALVLNDIWYINNRGLYPDLEYDLYMFSKDFCNLKYLSPFKGCCCCLKGLELFKKMGALHQISLLCLIRKGLSRVKDIEDLIYLSSAYDIVLGENGEEIAVDVLEDYFKGKYNAFDLESDPTPRRLRSLDSFINKEY